MGVAGLGGDARVELEAQVAELKAWTARLAQLSETLPTGHRVSCRRHVKAAAQTDRVRMQCIVDVMQRFGMLKLRFNVSQMIS